MEEQSDSVGAFGIVRLLKTCASQKDLAAGHTLHAYIREHKSLRKNSHVANSLVNMYAKCGALAKAQELLEKLPVRDVVTWSALMAGYAQQGQPEEALQCFDSMQREGHSPDEVTFTCALKACGSIRAAAKGIEIHEQITSLGMLEKNVVLGNALLDMYAKCAALAKARQVFENLPVRDVVTWSALISGYVEQGQGEKALKYFDSMQLEGHTPDMVTITCVLKACGSIGAVDRGRRIHEKIVISGMLKKHVVIGNSLVDMYAKCRDLMKAQQVLEELPVRDVVTWNTIIAGYAQQGQWGEALKCFDSMEQEGHHPNEVTFICALKACESIGAASKGEEVHGKIVNLGILEKHIMLGNTLLDMYVKCGALTKAKQVFEALPTRDIVTWSALIGGYAQQGQGEEALKCFDSMQHEGYPPNVVTLTIALKACGSIGASAKGEHIHYMIVRLGMLEKDIVVGNALVDMYAKCGALAKAQEVLEELPVYDVVTWSALIAGYAQQGQSLEAVNCLVRMQFKGVKPNLTTLMCTLNAYSHSGLLDQVEAFFLIVRSKYGITQGEEYCCMVDLFARAGKFKKALAMIERMPFDECLPLWVALLGSCRKWGNVKIGRLAFKRAVCLDKRNSAIYGCMADIYLTVGMQGDANDIEKMRFKTCTS